MFDCTNNKYFPKPLISYFFYVPLFLAFAAVKAVSFYYQQAFLCTIVSVNPEVFITPMA